MKQSIAKLTYGLLVAAIVLAIPLFHTKPAAAAPAPFYRLYSPRFNSHFYTANAIERDGAIRAGYRSEGFEGHIDNTAGATALYRLFRPASGKHFYTMHLAEAAQVQAIGYRMEGVAGYVFTHPGPGLTPLHRSYNPRSGDHLYTIDPAGRDFASARLGYGYEGIAAYVYGSTPNQVAAAPSPTTGPAQAAVSPTPQPAAQPNPQPAVQPSPQPTAGRLNRPLVSLTFDDGWKGIHTYGLPVLDKYGFKSTQYVNTEPTAGEYPDYMNLGELQDIARRGHEIASHTKSHTNLTQLSLAQISDELVGSQIILSQWTGVSPRNFATPFGAYNPPIVNEVRKYYGSHRSVDEGYNDRGFDPYNIRVQNIVASTPVSQVQGWINQALASGTWLVLVYHQVSPSLPPNAVGEPPDQQYWTTPTDLDAELAHLKNSGIAVVTVQQALDEITTQR